MLQADASTPAAIPTERDHHRRQVSVPQLEDGLHACSSARRPSSSPGSRPRRRTTTNDFDAAYLERRHRRCTIRLRRARRRSTITRTSAPATCCCRTRSTRCRRRPACGSRMRRRISTCAPPDEQFDRRYASAYPSAILSYNFTPLRQAKISYSRRVSRPNPYQLSPIEFRQDTRNVFRGNPDASRRVHRRAGARLSGVALVGLDPVEPVPAAHGARGAQHPVRRFHRRVGEHVRQRREHDDRGLGPQPQRASRPAAARRRRQRLSLLERRVEPRRQPVDARHRVVGAHERDVEVLAARRRAGVRVLSRAVRDGRRLAARRRSR